MTTTLPAVPVIAPVKSALICDDRPSVRRLLTQALTGGMTVDVIGAVADAFAVADAYAARPADVVLIGIHRGSTTGSDAMAILLGLHPTTAVVVFGASRDTGLLITALARGARGLMLWDHTHPNLPAPDAVPNIPAELAHTDPITNRELQVLQGISEGKSNSSIGHDLFLSEDTIKTHARRLFGKLRARDRAHAVMIGLRLDLIG